MNSTFCLSKDPTRNEKGRKFERKKFNHAVSLRFQKYNKRITA